MQCPFLLTRHSLTLSSDPATAAETARSEREIANSQRGFFKLPAEIRDQIYLEVNLGYKFVILQRTWRKPMGFGASPPHLGLLQVCRATCMETTPMIYGQTEFYLWTSREDRNCFQPCGEWIRGADPKALSSLRSLTMLVIFRCSECGARATSHLFGNCPSIKAIIQRVDLNKPLLVLGSRRCDECDHKPFHELEVVGDIFRAFGFDQDPTVWRKEVFLQIMEMLEQLYDCFSSLPEDACARNIDKELRVH